MVESCDGRWWRAVLDGGGGLCWEVEERCVGRWWRATVKMGAAIHAKFLMGLVGILTGMREEGSILNPFKCYNLLR